jgi:hypothetical protein
MNGPMKQLAVLVGVLGIALFGMVGMAASAQSASPYSVHGLYAVTGFSSCSPDGLGVMEADYTFSNEGTVSAQGVVRNIDASGGWSAAFEATFTYEVTQGGRITFAYPWHGLKIYRTYPDGEQWWLQWDAGPSHGVISPDGKTITITCGPPKTLTVFAVSDNAPPIVGMQASCVTTAMGMRLK